MRQAGCPARSTPGGARPSGAGGQGLRPRHPQCFGWIPIEIDANASRVSHRRPWLNLPPRPSKRVSGCFTLIICLNVAFNASDQVISKAVEALSLYTGANMSTVSPPNHGKLKSVLQRLDRGWLIDTPTLAGLGVSRKLAHRYLASGWLEPVAHGLYRRPDPSGRPVEWQTVVRSLQHVMNYRSVVGGRTALELQGFEHYLHLGGPPEVHLYGDKHPSWLKRLGGESRYVLHGTRLFREGTAACTDVETRGGELRCSSPERAVLELLDAVPKAVSFHVVDTVFESFASASPRRLTDLLERCRSVKVKRLFFVFADRHGHAWRKHLSAESFNLGSGDRALVAGGRLHPQYRITVPADFMPRESKDVEGA